MAINYAEYPSGSDVQDFLTAAGISLTAFDSDDFSLNAAAAAAEFERQTGWYPFLASQNASTRYFDPPRTGGTAGRWAASRGGRVLELNAGLLNISDTGLSIGVYPSTLAESGINNGITASVGSAGVVLTRDIQYYLKPDNANLQVLPWTVVEFLGPITGLPKSIAITGVWGRVSAVPADAWRAICGYAASLMTPQAGLTVTGGIQALKEGDTDTKYSSGTFSIFSAERQAWEKTFFKAVRAYVRV